MNVIPLPLDTKSRLVGILLKPINRMNVTVNMNYFKCFAKTAVDTVIVNF